MDKDVARLNIEHYRALLGKEVDATKRRTIIRLLAEEESILAELERQTAKQEHR